MRQNDEVKLRAGEVQREANHAGKIFQNMDATLPARQLQLHVLAHPFVLDTFPSDLQNLLCHRGVHSGISAVMNPGSFCRVSICPILGNGSTGFLLLLLNPRILSLMLMLALVAFLSVTFTTRS